MFSVLDVGDGACSVLRRGEQVAVIDCGSNDLGREAACNRLLAAIGNHPEIITTIIVTHFDTDHYAGFLRLAEQMYARGARFPHLRLIAPRPPHRDYSAQYLALAMVGTGISNLNLARELRKVTAGQFSYIPVSRKYVRASHRYTSASSHRYAHFTAGGINFTVHWPPRYLLPRVAGQVRTAMQLYESLADKLRERGITVLDDNLRITRRYEWPSPRPTNADDILDATGKPDQGHDLIDSEALSAEQEQELDFQEIKDLELPKDLQEEGQRAWDAFRKANNNMSIVFDDAYNHSLAAFGDAGESVLRWLAKLGNLAPQYCVMLAPHHGTQVLPANFYVKAEVCISQNGSMRGDRWHYHVDSHGSPGSCVTTRLGSHHVYI